ncbi:MAG: hypothetical protein AABX47_09080 [Nanoarchaeota archaeon]
MASALATDGPRISESEIKRIFARMARRTKSIKKAFREAGLEHVTGSEMVHAMRGD